MTTNNGNDETQFGGGDATHVGGTPPTTPDEPSDNRKLWLIALGALLVGLLIGVGVAVAGGGGDDKKQAGDDTSTSTSSSTSTSTSTLPPTTQATSGGGGGGSGGTTSTTTLSDDPKINSFSTNPGNKTCTTQTQNISVTVSWNTSNTSENVFAVGGPSAGPYDTYPGTSGSVTLNPACPAPGETIGYQYTLHAKGPNGPEAVRTITFNVNTIAI